MNFSEIFVCEDKECSTFQKNVPSPLFRKSFVLEEEPQSAGIVVGTTGFYDLFVNGKKITKGFLAPYVSNHDHIVYFDEYDIKKYLSKGENVIGVMLGDGFTVGKTEVWDFSLNVTNQAPLLSIRVDISLENKEMGYQANDFVCKKGPVIFNDMRTGVFYDARLLEDGWCSPGFFEIDWHSPIICKKPRGRFKTCEAEPIRAYKEIKPVSIKAGEIYPYKPSISLTPCEPFEGPVPYTGGYIYDFGENNSGIYRLKIKGKAGQKINIQCGEQLTEGKLNYSNIGFYYDGFSQRDIYYLKGEGEEIFEPMFTYHGYRYIYVEGITKEQATEDLLTYMALSSDVCERGTFECSDPVANQIYAMGRRSDISNFYYFPLDCPHREKNGWTGDMSLSAEHMMQSIGAEKSFREWLVNFRLSQKPDGNLPGICPTDSWGYWNGPAWDNALFELPYMVYKYRGETDIIRENASAMLRYLDFISQKRNEKGIVWYGLGDWVPVNKAADAFDSDLGFTSSTYVYHMCKTSEEMFDAVNLPLHKAFAKKLGEELLEAIRKEYIDFETYIVRNKCQTSQAMAIYYNIFREEEKEKAFKILMDIIEEDNFSITSGCLGLRVIFHVLSDFGQVDLAYKMITKPEFPSYGYWVAKGETTMLETFHPYDDFYDSSKNHHFLSDVTGWFSKVLGGINVINSKEVVISPKFAKQLSYCKATHKLPEGDVEVCWERKDGVIDLKVICSEKISCKVVISDCSDKVVLS